MPAAELPNVNASGTTNAVLSNHRSIVGLDSVPEPIRFGRCAPTPLLATSREIVGVNGRPLRKLTIVWTCHPPSRGLFLANGNAYPELNANRWGVSEGVGPSSYT